MGGQNAPQTKPEGSGQPVDTHVDTVATTPALDEAARQQGEARLRELEAQKKAAREAGNEEAAKAAETAEAQLRQELEGAVAPDASNSSPDKKGESQAKNFIEQFIEGIKAIFAQIAAALGLTTGEKKEDEKDKDKKGKGAPKKPGEEITMEEEPVDIPGVPIVERYEAVHASPRRAKITHILIHTGGGRASGAQLAKYLSNPGDGRRVSSHFSIGKDGDLYQICSLNKQAWHTSGKDPETGEYYNQESVGFDFANAPGEEFTEEQYKTASKLCAYLVKKFDIDIDNIIGHDETPYDNHGDPGDLFDWDKFRAMIRAEL